MQNARTLFLDGIAVVDRRTLWAYYFHVKAAGLFEGTPSVTTHFAQEGLFRLGGLAAFTAFAEADLLHRESIFSQTLAWTSVSHSESARLHTHMHGVHWCKAAWE